MALQSEGITAMRAASHVGAEASVANTIGREINQVARELTEVKTSVEPVGTPALGTAPEPMPIGRDPVPTGPNAPTGCFIAGTVVLTPDGERDIETIQVGDYVMADDPNTPGDIQARRVVQTYVHEVMTVIDLYIDGEVITATEEHPFWVPELGWVKAKDLQEGTIVQTDYETFLDVDKVVRREGNFTVYNFQVGEFHSYFISDLGILVHNNCNKGTEPPSPALEGNPYHPDIVEQRIRPPYDPNPAHDPNDPRGFYNPNKTPEPPDSQDVYKDSVRGSLTTWFGKNINGDVYGYFMDSNGISHFSGTIPPNQYSGIVPNNVLKQLGIKP